MVTRQIIKEIVFFSCEKMLFLGELLCDHGVDVRHLRQM
jgi:hypothetical protein